ncbi:Delta(24)-sterol reductase [Quaeritorhiza haematococci]|nr:Delta(24)-sterol reductase [Quaeritorhiza haematococci]
MGNNPIFRFFLGWMMPPKISLLKLTQGKRTAEYYVDVQVNQDFLVPISKLKAGMDAAHEIYDIYPVWLCPHLVLKTTPQGAIRAPEPAGEEREMYVDIGIWGPTGPAQRKEVYSARAANKMYEGFLRSNRGYQATYAKTEQTREEFATMFDLGLYSVCRKKYHAEGVFMDVYDKVAGIKPAVEKKKD